MNYRFDKIAFNSTAKKTPTESDKEHHIGLEHIDSECLEITRWGSDVAPIGEKLIMKKGDVLFGKRRAYQRKLAIAPFDGIFSAHGMVLRPNEEVVDKNYFPFFMSSDLFMERAVQISVGGLSPTINWKDLREQEFSLPSLAEQKVLSDKLWAAYRLKESYKKLLTATEEMVKSQFIEMFGGGNWPQKTLGEVGSFTRGGGFLKSDFVEHGIPCIHYGQIHTKFGPFITSHITEISSDLESKTKFASKGDLVIAITSEDTEGSCKSTAWLGDYPVAVGGHAAIYKHSMNPLYMSFFFKSTLFNYAKIEYVHGTKVFEIKPDDIAKILVPCPPMSLQNQFSAIAEQSDKSGFDGRKSQFIEMFGDFHNKVQIKDVCLVVSGKSIPTKLEDIDGNNPYIKVADFNIPGNEKYITIAQRYVSDDSASYSKQIPEGSVIFAKNGAASMSNKKRLTKIRCCIDMNTMAVFPKNESILSDFLFATIEAMDVSSHVRQGAIPSISPKSIEDSYIAMPTMEEQYRYVSIAKHADKSGSVLLKLSSR